MFRVFVPTYAARRKPLGLHGCNILGTRAMNTSAYTLSWALNIKGHIIPMPCCLWDYTQKGHAGSPSRQGSWSSLMIYCLCQSLLLCCRRSQPWEKSLQAALAQAASSPNCSAGCICMAWGRVQPCEATSAPANPRQPTLTSPPCAIWVTGRLSLLSHRLADIQGAEFHPAARENTWWHHHVPPCLICFGLLYMQWDSLKSAGNQSLAFF